jgi:hypothetical protein
MNNIPEKTPIVATEKLQRRIPSSPSANHWVAPSSSPTLLPPLHYTRTSPILGFGPSLFTLWTPHDTFVDEMYLSKLEVFIDRTSATLPPLVNPTGR